MTASRTATAIGMGALGAGPVLAMMTLVFQSPFVLAQPEPPLSPVAADQGAQIYETAGCVGCHGEQGEGRAGVAPALAGNPQLSDTTHVATQILVGRGSMPPFAHRLNDEEIAAVASYVRTAWNNELGAIQPATVDATRQSPTVQETLQRQLDAAQSGEMSVAQNDDQATPDPAETNEQSASAPTEAPADPAAETAQAGPPDPSQGPSSMPAYGEEIEISPDIYAGGGGTASQLVHVPVSSLYPGTVPAEPQITSPVADDPEAVQRGNAYYNQFNCIGCHAPHGAGGMGPSLSNSSFLYGSKPEQIYLTILQGRPKGMPAWGGMLPDDIIWDLVAYIKSISKEPAGQWGKTISADGFTIEQVPAQDIDTTDPWAHTQPFSYGQPPYEKVQGSPPLETPDE